MAIGITMKIRNAVVSRLSSRSGYSTSNCTGWEVPASIVNLRSSESPRLDYALQELLCPRLLRVGEDLMWRTFLQDQPVVEEADPARDVPREAHLVRCDQHRHAALGELADHVQPLGHQLRVERRGDLVEQHQLRPHRERADDRDPLLLATRESVGVLVAAALEPEAREQVEGARLGLGA